MAATKRELENEVERLKRKLDQMVRVLRDERDLNTAMRDEPAYLTGHPIPVRYWQSRINKISSVLAGWP